MRNDDILSLLGRQLSDLELRGEEALYSQAAAACSRVCLTEVGRGSGEGRLRSRVTIDSCSSFTDFLEQVFLQFAVYS